MRGLLLITLPALALAAVASLDPRQSPRRVRVVAANRLDGNGCPPGNFFFTPSHDQPGIDPAGTLIFGAYNVTVGPQDQGNSREKFCGFQVTFEFPQGCTKGSVRLQPRGFVQLEPGTEAFFSSQNDISPGTLGPSPPPIRFFESQPGFLEDYRIPVREDVLENQQNVTFTARTRIFVVQPGPIQQAAFSIDSLDLSIAEATAC